MATAFPRLPFAMTETAEELYFSEVLGLGRLIEEIKASQCRPAGPVDPVGVYLGAAQGRPSLIPGSEEQVMLEKMAQAMGLDRSFRVFSSLEDLSSLSVRVLILFVSEPEPEELKVLESRQIQLPDLGQWGELGAVPCLRTHSLQDLVLRQGQDAEGVKSRKKATWEHLQKVMQRLKQKVRG